MWLAVAVGIASVAVVPVSAHADVCGSVGGRRGHVSVGGCTDIAGAIADADLLTGCGNVGGPRGRIDVSGCT